ncbi:MAG TPA: CbiQ family ECF transporter T component [Rhodocyclaceae bacterium]|nr:CbiQ family ECF transporter T component [Rhodocyclaceae bacterium]
MALPRLDPEALLLLTLVSLLAARWCAGAILRALLRRCRWLLLSMVVLFLWMTPGLRLPDPLGALGWTREGLMAGAEHIGRLLLVLALLALLLSRLAHEGIVAALYLLLAPLTMAGVDRRRLAVRMLLALEYVAAARSDWKEVFHDTGGYGADDNLVLYFQPMAWYDVALLTGIVAAVGWGVVV